MSRLLPEDHHLLRPLGPRLRDQVGKGELGVRTEQTGRRREGRGGEPPRVLCLCVDAAWGPGDHGPGFPWLTATLLGQEPNFPRSWEAEGGAGSCRKHNVCVCDRVLVLVGVVRVTVCASDLLSQGSGAAPPAAGWVVTPGPLLPWSASSPEIP